MDGDFGMATRSGLRYAPPVYRLPGTGRRGRVCFSLGPVDTLEDIDQGLDAMGKIWATG